MKCRIMPHFIMAFTVCQSTSLGMAKSQTLVEIDHEIILGSFSSLPLIHSRRVIVSYKRKYMHKLLVNRLFKLAQEKVWLYVHVGEPTVPPRP